MSAWTLVFSDPKLEDVFAKQVANATTRVTGITYSLVLIYSLYALFMKDALTWGGYSCILYNVSWMVAAVTMLLLLMLSHCASRSCRLALHAECSAALTLSLVVWVRCLFGSRELLRELFDEDARYFLDAAASDDEEVLMHVSVLMMYLGMHAQIRFKFLVIPFLSAAMSYPISLALTTSAVGGMLSYRHLMNCAMFLLLVTLAFWGQRHCEMTRRQALLHRVLGETKSLALEDSRQSLRRRSSHRGGVPKSHQLDLFREVHYTNVERQVERQVGSPRTAISGGSLGSDCPTWAVVESATEAVPEEDLQPGRVLPNSNIAKALPAGTSTDWEAVDQAIKQIRDPEYSLKAFHDHMVKAFPELGLYTFNNSDSPDAPVAEARSQEMLSSGRSRLDELARTFGAFYSIYWLLRLDLDGKQGFCFGYDDEFELKPVLGLDCLETVEQKAFTDMIPAEKRLHTFQHFPWLECEELLTSAGLLSRQCARDVEAPGEVSETWVCHTRLRALLALTAMHDVMKNEALCPTVQPGHAPFCNYQEGEVILDHDVALDYVLGFFGDVFPSFRGLDVESQKLVRFTQGKMGFNNGWLVQGEAPPSGLFRDFKRVITNGHASSEDVAFYFAHWLTDLAGAEPTPLNGAEKLVLKMPGRVVRSFFTSMPFVWELSERSETQVLEKYLRAQWQADERLGPVPMGDESIALMRLSLQMQGQGGDSVREVFGALSQRDREVLSEEMARTGLPGQHFQSTKPCSGCPALLVYYGPAFIQKNRTQLLGALAILAEIYRKGRRLFPLDRRTLRTQSKGSVSGLEPNVHTATLRIHLLKELCAAQLQSQQPRRPSESEFFCLVKKSDIEAVVEKHSLSAINQILLGSVRCQLLEFEVSDSFCAAATPG